MVSKDILKGLLLFALFLSALGLAADDGSWSKSFTLAAGSVYSEEDNGSIILEKELLEFNGKSTEVKFLFTNTSDERIVLSCGFPVVQRIQTYIRNGYAEIPIGKYGDSVVIPGIDYFETISHPECDDDEPMFVFQDVIVLNEFNNSREFIGAEIPEELGVDFSLTQDGKAVIVDDILLERTVNEEYSGLTFHFKHELIFPPHRSSTVTVSYTQDLLYGNDGGLTADIFKWRYVIGTGSTWKGPIGEIFIIKPQSWSGELKGLELINRKQQYGVDIFYASNYEPDREESFELTSRPVGMEKEYMFYSDFPDMKRKWVEKVLTFPFDNRPADNIVATVSASSFLPDTVNVFTEVGVMESAHFTAAAAFDGCTETSWCENARGNGLGEYIEVEIEKPAAGLIIHNGFKRFTVEDWVFNTDTFERVVRDDDAGLKDYFSMNSRVKILEVQDSLGTVLAVLQLDDQRDAQTFFGFNLRPGRYRFVIIDTYSGSKWQDTCIAEISFIQSDSAGLISKLFKDPFYSQFVTVKKYWR